MAAFASASRHLRERRYGELLFKSEIWARRQLAAARFQLGRSFRPNGLRRVLSHGAPMLVDLRDVGISRDLYLYGQRERFATAYFEELLQDDDVVIDIGANI